MVNRRPIEIAGKFTTPPLLALAGGGFCQGKRILVGEDGKQVVVIPCGQLSPGFD